MAEVVVTGATGFVGRHLLARLLRDGHAVRGTVWTGEPAVVLPEGVTAVPIEAIGPETEWGHLLAGVDTVFHLAARVHVMKEPGGDPLMLYREVNVAGTERLARQAASAGVRRLVFLSSVKVHGEETREPYREDSPLAPRDPYGISKMEGEDALRRIEREAGLEIVILRPPLVYGPGVKANFLELLRCVDRGWPLPLASTRNARSLIYVGNLVDALTRCGDDSRAAGKTYLISDGEDVSTSRLVRFMAAALGRPPRLVPFPIGLLSLAGRLAGRRATVDRLVGSLQADSTRIRAEIGWMPPFSMEDGLLQTAKWFRSGKTELESRK